MSIMPLVPRRVARRHLASLSREACIVAAGKFGDTYGLLKNRDRNYVPKVKVVHEVRDGVEVAYLKDEKTGWVEGLNEHGIGVVNAALMVSRDESERDEVARTGKKLLDGDRILKALTERTVAAAAKVVRSYKGGLRGHTIISDGQKTLYVEMPDSNDVEYDEVNLDELFVRTNHGVEFPDAGYVEGPREESSKDRQSSAEDVLAEVKSLDQAAPALLRAREDRWEPTEMVRDHRSPQKMRTTTQMVLDLEGLRLILYLLPGRVEYLGLDDRLPKDFESKIKVDVREYDDLSVDTDGKSSPVKKVKKGSEDLLPIMDPAFNIREVFKQLALLEDHLVNPRKRCTDCIWKHMLTAEALAEEAMGLGGHPDAENLAERLRHLQRGVRGGIPFDQVAQAARDIRKSLLSTASSVKVGSLDQVPAVEQETEWSCGAAALRAVLAYFGTDVPEPDLRAVLGTNPERGTDLDALVTWTKKLGLAAHAATLELDDLRKLTAAGVPAILNVQAWGGGHYAVAVEVDDAQEQVVFQDPYAGGRRSLAFSDLERRWWGGDGHRVALAVHPSAPLLASLLGGRGKVARTEVLDEGLISKLRKGTLQIARVAESVDNLRDAEKVRRAAVRWSNEIEQVAAQVREDMRARVHAADMHLKGFPHPRRPLADKDWADHYAKNQKPLWELRHELSGPPSTPEVKSKYGGTFEEPEILRARLIEFYIKDGYSEAEATIRVDNYLWRDPPETRAEAEARTLAKWKEEARKWARRLRDRARKAWEWLEEVRAWTLREYYARGGGGDPIEIVNPTDERVTLAGFQMVFRGFDDLQDDDKWDTLEALKEGLRRYRQRAQAVLPVILQKQLPMRAEWLFDPTRSGDSAAATYERTYIRLTPWALDKDPDSTVHTFAHEMGHHLYRTVLSDSAQKFWNTAVRGDYGPLDLREALKVLRSFGTENSSVVDKKLAQHDPVLFLQLQTLMHDLSYKHHDLWNADSIQRYLDRGEPPVVRVPQSPITGYSGKNSEEAFCEAVGRLIAYGPLVIPARVRGWLRIVLPSIKIGASPAAPGDGYFQEGDPVLFGKFQNKPGILRRVFQDERGIPMIEVEPHPKGRKKNRVMGLYRIRHADPARRVASTWLRQAVEDYGLPGAITMPSEEAADRLGRRALSAAHEDRMPGGLADKRKPSDFDPAELAMGTKVEMEHVDDRALAREIAMDHLAEIPDYYTRLQKMEAESRRKASDPLVSALRRLDGILVEAIRRMDVADDTSDWTAYEQWVGEQVGDLLNAVREVDAVWTGKVSQVGPSHARYAREVLEGGAWTVHMADGGYSRLTLHGPGDTGPRLTFDPGAASHTTLPGWERLLDAGIATRGGHIKLGGAR